MLCVSKIIRFAILNFWLLSLEKINANTLASRFSELDGAGACSDNKKVRKFIYVMQIK